MASSSSSGPSAAAGKADRLSALPDAVLGHLLSFLPTKEAGRAARLARRWRHVFCNVHTVSFSERAGDRSDDWSTFYYDASERKSCSWAILDDVCSALLCRRRCAGHGVPLRALRFAFDSCHGWDGPHVDTWLAHALRHSRCSQELCLDLCFYLGQICGGGGNGGGGGESDDDDEEKGRRWYGFRHVLPRGIFSCAALRELSLCSCWLKLQRPPAAAVAIDLPNLETLRLADITRDSGKSVQRLISSCPRLADLTLESIPRLKRVSVLHRPLRRFSLRCCHGLKSVEVDASELRAFEYRGEPPLESLLSLHGLQGVNISSCALDFCRTSSSKHLGADLVRFRSLMQKISDARQLRLHHGKLESRFFLGLPSFPNLVRLALQGPIWRRADAVVVGRVLAQTPSLEVLSLYMEPPPPPPPEAPRYRHRRPSSNEQQPQQQEQEQEEDASSRISPDEIGVPEESSFAAMACLRQRLREINMVHYWGDEAQRMVARLLLRSTPVLERVCVVLVKGTFEAQAKMKEEIESWVVAVDAEKVFL